MQAVQHKPMSRRTIAIAAVLSVLALASALFTGCSNSARNIHFRSAKLKHERGNYQGAIDDYTKVIGIVGVLVYVYLVYANQDVLITALKQPLN